MNAHSVQLRPIFDRKIQVMKPSTFWFIFPVLLAFAASSCTRTDINQRCCNKDYKIITQNYHVPDSFTLFIPQAFSPNADGLNDEFYPMGFGWKVEHMVVKKSSKIVFESYNYLEAVWNGGEERDGRYNYEIQFRSDVGDLFEVKGNVCIMRFGTSGERLPEMEREVICDCTTADMVDSVRGIINETKDCPTTSLL
jgi:hypothetical protein